MNTDSFQILDTSDAAYVKTNVTGSAAIFGRQVWPVRFDWTATQAAALSTTGVHAAVTDNGSDRDITSSITNPPCARNITATAGGTAGDVKAIQVVIYGTDANGDVINETLPAFTVNTTGTVQGSKAFATVTRIVIPAHDGTGATTAIGWGDKLGLPIKMERNTVRAAYLADVLEGTGPTVAVSSSVLASNTVLLNSALAGTAVKVYAYLP